MDGIANALFHFDKKDIPIFYDESTEKITVYFGDEGVALPDHMNKIIVRRLGVLTDGLILYKLSVPLFNTCTIMDGDTLVNVAQGTQNSDVDYYIRDYKPESTYTEMRLQFAELNYFLPSTGRAEITDKQIVLSREKDQIYNFDTRLTGRKTISISPSPLPTVTNAVTISSLQSSSCERIWRYTSLSVAVNRGLRISIRAI